MLLWLVVALRPFVSLSLFARRDVRVLSVVFPSSPRYSPHHVVSSCCRRPRRRRRRRRGRDLSASSHATTPSRARLRVFVSSAVLDVVTILRIPASSLEGIPPVPASISSRFPPVVASFLSRRSFPPFAVGSCTTIIDSFPGSSTPPPSVASPSPVSLEPVAVERFSPHLSSSYFSPGPGTVDELAFSQTCAVLVCTMRTVVPSCLFVLSTPVSAYMFPHPTALCFVLPPYPPPPPSPLPLIRPLPISFSSAACPLSPLLIQLRALFLGCKPFRSLEIFAALSWLQSDHLQQRAAAR